MVDGRGKGGKVERGAHPQSPKVVVEIGVKIFGGLGDKGKDIAR